MGCRRPNFALVMFVEDCEAPTLLAPFRRCDLYAVGEEDARAALAAYLAPAAKPTNRFVFQAAKDCQRSLLHTLGRGLN
jgi:hypothetical protein